MGLDMKVRKLEYLKPVESKGCNFMIIKREIQNPCLLEVFMK